MDLRNFKQGLAHTLDDNLHTKQWHNYVDYTIIGMILLSTTSIFISTFDIQPWLRDVIDWVDILTLAFFTVEVTCRIWIAPLINPKWKGVKGRLRYCFTFWGLIDVLSTYPFYLQLFFSVPVAMLRVLRLARVARTLRLGCYSKSATLWVESIAKKKNELILSVGFLVIATVILSLMLFFAEHEVQPDVYNDGSVSMLWAFAQYIGDTGNFATTPPVTQIGKVIASIIGFLGIAIFAIPTGIFAAGFSEALDKRKHQEKVKNNIKAVHTSFERIQDSSTKFQIVPHFYSLPQLQVYTGLSESDIVEAVDQSENMRLINLATTQPISDNPQDRLAVEHFVVNRPYGCCINRGSKVTIVETSAICEATLGNFAFYLAMIGGFNYISRETGELKPYKSYYIFDGDGNDDNQKAFLEDLRQLTTGDDCWAFFVLAASGNQEPQYLTELHFNYGGKKGDETYNDPNITLYDTKTFEEFYQNASVKLLNDFEIGCDKQRYYNTSGSKNIMRKLGNKVNAVTIRTAWRIAAWDVRRIAIAKLLADVMNTYFDTNVEKQYPGELKQKDIAFNGYDIKSMED